MTDPETEHLMVRAEEEAVLAIQAEHPAAVRAHQDLALLYSQKVVNDLRAEEANLVGDCATPANPV